MDGTPFLFVNGCYSSIYQCARRGAGGEIPRRVAQQENYAMAAPAAMAAKSVSTSPLSHPAVRSRFKAGFQRRVVFAVARGVGRAGGARRGCVASVREILAEDGFRPAVRADRAGGGVIILREPLENAADTGERFCLFRRRRNLRQRSRRNCRGLRRLRRGCGGPAAAIAPARNTSVNIRMTTLFFIVFSFREAFIRRGRSRPYCRLIPHCSALRESAP